METAFVLLIIASSYVIWQLLSKSEPKATSCITNLIDAAKSDIEFQNELKVHEPKYYKIQPNWHLEQKIFYSAIYMGWLIGKGTYNENDYK